MSQTKRAIDDAAELLDVPVDDLTRWLMHGEYRSMPPHGAVASHVTATVYRAADDLNVHPTDLAGWLDARAADKAAERAPGDVPVVRLVEVIGPAYVTVPDGTTVGLHLPAGKTVEVAKHNTASYRLNLYTSPHLVGEDDYRGVAADLIARWADDHIDAATALASLNLAAHGMPVTTPSRRALDKIRAYVAQIGGEDDARDVARHLTAILDEVGA